MFASTEVKDIFPTPIWVLDLPEEKANSLNTDLRRTIYALTAPLREIPLGSTWQTDPTLQQRREFAEFSELVRQAAKGALSFLQVEYEHFEITGCWANINPQGGLNSAHTHPNNYLSGVYYVAVPPVGSRILFQDPRGQASMIMPKPRQYTRLTANGANAASKDGRMVIFPAWLKHTVPANDGQSERISISFNLMFKNFSETMATPMWDPTAGKERT